MDQHEQIPEQVRTSKLIYHAPKGALSNSQGKGRKNLNKEKVAHRQEKLRNFVKIEKRRENILKCKKVQ